MTSEQITAAIAEKQSRLAAYRARELVMLSPDGVKSYGLGTRNIQRYDTNLSDIQKMIKTLENEISGLEGMQSGTGRRAARGVVPMDI